MKLRAWQSECIESAISKYHSSKHFLALATPGAGKTIMASVLAKKLFDQGKIDLVLCFSPSSMVSYDFSAALSEQFGAHFDGAMGAMGNAYTYQALNNLDDSVWLLFLRYRIFVIFDEIHHCAGASLQNSNTWGARIIEKIKENACYSIALTGTPWRSDALPIALAEYCNESGNIQCDYTYGLKAAIDDNVCRVPQVVALDNDNISLREGDEVNLFNSFTDLLSRSQVSYSKIVINESVIEQLIIIANLKLNELRTFNNNAGGLVVASSISHAFQIQQIIHKILGEAAVVVTSDEIEASSMISDYRHGSEKWIISVGMISEGTNIPRLQVCCYLSNVKTEMYYRQVLGRILRFTLTENQEAVFFMPAEPHLLEYAHRVVQDIPEDLAKVKMVAMDQPLMTDIEIDDQVADFDNTVETAIVVSDEPTLVLTTDVHSVASFNEEEGFISQNLLEVCERSMDVTGSFSHSALAIEGLDHLYISKDSLEKLAIYSNESF
jgi:superfamily II DNA or RNA helicase